MTPTTATATLVESIPQGLDDLRGTVGVEYTENVLVGLVDAARSHIDLTAMYWALLADPKSDDESGFSPEQLDAMGARTGKALYGALLAAAARGVKLRILQSPGFGKPGADPETPVVQESDLIAKAHPDAVAIHAITMGDWYGGAGIMHQKVWVFDGLHVYIGSANMDWKSIMQVKEMGVVVRDCPQLAEDVRLYFEAWWAFSAIKPPQPVVAYDPRAGVTRSVPPWSALQRDVPSPLTQDSTAFNRSTPLALTLNGEAGSVFVTGAPDDIRGAGRTWDGEGLVYTIDDAQASVCISVMDFAPVSIYSRKTEDAPADDPKNTPVWWPDLFDALLRAVLTRKLQVRLLISHWAHSSPMIEPYLRALQQAADAASKDRYMQTGRLEIRQFEVPGWDSTVGHQRVYPGHTRVNHTKYVVTDRRCNIGTSNMSWDYFSSTAGASFNADHPSLVKKLQAVFDRDWMSRYASLLKQSAP